ncbi:MAG: V-type ATPase subunit [Clostridia bacterium]|nr:V-type ATPase subunit [Clostridia bacterium]
MKDTEYTYAVAYMKTLENKMLSQNDFEALLSSPDVKSGIKLLIDKGYGANLSGTEGIDEILASELEKIWTEAKNVCPDGAPLDVLLYQNDYHNLKTILKASVTNVDWHDMLLKPCITDPENISEAIKTTDFESLPDFIKEEAREAYKIITETNDGQLTEIYLDKACWEQMAKRAYDEKNDFLIGWVNLNITVADFKIAVRAVGKSKEFIKDALIRSDGFNPDKLVEAALSSLQAVIDAIASYGYADAADCLKESFSAFEKWCDNQKIRYIKKAKLKNFGFEPILGFLIGKEFELQTVRIILSGKANNVPVQIIKERLRDLYV